MKTVWPYLGLGSAAILFPAWGSAHAQCTPEWRTFPPGGATSTVYALLDDASVQGTPTLYVAGDFGVRAWNGSAWVPIGSVAGRAAALTVYDPPGPAAPVVVAGGDFLIAGGAAANRIAAWNGASWSPLAGGLSGPVWSLAVFDDDGAGPNPPALFAGGEFTGGIAKWNGATWSSLGSGVSGTVYALAVFDDDGAGPNPAALYAGGHLTAAGGTSVGNVARWDGSSWSALGSGVGTVDDYLRALVVHDEDGPGGTDPVLIAGGSFHTAGGVGATKVARWNGASWSPLASGVGLWGDDSVFSLLVFDDDGPGPRPTSLFAGGRFTPGTTTGGQRNRIARWDGTAWEYLPNDWNDPTGWVVLALCGFDDDGAGPHRPLLHLGGMFHHWLGLAANNVARWDGAAWSGLDGTGTENNVKCLAVLDEDGPGSGEPALFVGGEFRSVGTGVAERIARFDGTSWSTLSGGIDSTIGGDSVQAITMFDDDGPGPQPSRLYAGGYFAAADGATVYSLARWDGSGWSDVGGGLLESIGVFALAVFDDDQAGPRLPGLYAAGWFTEAGGVSANRIARWDGTSWSALGSGVESMYGVQVNALVVFDDDAQGPNPPALYAAGRFARVGGVDANHIARWNGSSWSPLGVGLGNRVLALAVFDDDGSGPVKPALYSGGEFITAGGASAYHIARWNGSAWTTLGSGVGDEIWHSVRAMAVHDEDGAGPGLPALYVGGEFDQAGGIPATNLARWSGSAWSSVPSGANDTVSALCSFDPDGSGPEPSALYLGGEFTSAGFGTSHHLAARTGCGSSVSPFCYGDGVAAACPCGNSGSFGRGCENSAGTGGALLGIAGNPSLSDDTLELTSSGERPTALSIFLQGNVATAHVAYGDGLRCVAGSLKRLYSKNAVGGVVSAPTAGEPSISSRSAARGDPFPAGATRYYQVYYRDPSPTFCPMPAGNTFNVSTGFAVSWNP